MPIDFPTSPTTGQVYTYLGKSWVYNGTAWDAPKALSEIGAVQTFANAAARTAAIPTPTEGIVSYLVDTNALELYNNGWNVINPSSGNAIINGAFEINQRGFTSTTATGVFIFDRWQTRADTGTSTFTNTAFALGSEPDSGNKTNRYLNINSTGQTLVSARTAILQLIESVKTFADETVTLSFYAKAASGTPFIAAHLEQIFGTGGSPSSTVVLNGKKIQIGTTWQRYSLTFDIPSLSGKTLGTNGNDRVSLFIYTSAGSNFNAVTDSLGIQTASIDIWGVQLEAGPTATPFRRNAPSIQAELAACQRYYVRFGGDDAYQFYGVAIAQNATAMVTTVSLPVPMRVRPSSVEFSTLSYQQNASTNVISVSNLFLAGAYHNRYIAAVEATTTGLTAGTSYRLIGNNSLASFLGFSAEL